MAILKVTWAVVYDDPSTHAHSYSYLGCLTPKVDSTQELGTIVERVFANRALAFKDPLAGHGEGDFIIEFYELPKWPCERDSPIGKIKEAFANTVTIEYLEFSCITLPDTDSYDEVEKHDSLMVVLSPAPSPRSSRRALDTVLEEGSATHHIVRENIAAAAQKRKSPSTGAKPQEMLKTQDTKRPDYVYKSRPLELSGPPTQVYHPAFATFLRMMRDPQQVSHEECGWALEYIDKSSRYYATEDDRKREMVTMTTAVHSRILDTLEFSLAPSRKFRPDGVIQTSRRPPGLKMSPVLCIHEIKNEIGEGGSDPFAQAECCYVAIYCSDEIHPVREISPCPCFLIGTAGTSITVGGAVFADGIIVQQLSTISTIPGPAEPGESPLGHAIYRVAKFLRALKASLKELEEYYDHLTVPSPTVPPTVPSSVASSVASSAAPSAISTGMSQLGRSSHTPASRRSRSSTKVSSPTKARTPAPGTQQLPYVGPHFTKFTKLTKSGEIEVTLEYTGRLGQEEFSKAVFTALAHTGTGTGAAAKVVVKFAHAYSCRGHKLLADHKLAPELWFCEKVESVDMYVVVMDFVPSRTIGPLSDADCECLRDAMKILHGEKLVFGDLRRPNILQCRGGGTMLIDFDWCGESGKARYPLDILIDDTMPWHEGVERGGLITKEHDNHLLNNLAGELGLRSAAPASGGEHV
ncbi:uncharacterized protein PHACADRAFT_210864 [Phanerochaete carnosa HHB-10118-sp]|uniref:Protein kinase domain-containing protein n=1 Tax=Phanerochaete carnosa (strain HHB-10118-sp) TaxID=650164 RepID=K5WRY7_PHACS|nr:uncharacterized protein PHACADRAFT_210864 [Phanerochaete carnosa HHB-10118-sp]EKM53157.1 hypothetical protein PHACADRAFT_210864 [Phanerochaete carnosa HHB-10118-sp]